MYRDIINSAFDKLVDELRRTKEGYIIQSEDNPEDFEGVDVNDVIIWLCESLN
jgi:hypothetical protein